MKKSLVILGNGFDKNLGLKTRYWDYFEYSSGDKIKDVIKILIDTDIKNLKRFSKKLNDKEILESKILKNQEKLSIYLDNYELDYNLTINSSMNDFKVEFNEIINNPVLRNKFDKMFNYLSANNPDKLIEELKNKLKTFISNELKGINENEYKSLKTCFKNVQKIFKEMNYNLLRTWRKDILVQLYFNKKHLATSFGLFIPFLLLLEPQYKNWDSIEEQIVKYVEDVLDIIENIYSIKSIDSSIDSEKNKIFNEKNRIQKIIKSFVKKVKNNKKNYTNSDLKNYNGIYKLIIQKTEEYKNWNLSENKNNNEKLWESYCNNIISKIEYINFILENIFFPDLYFENKWDKEELILKSKIGNGCYQVDLLKDLKVFENSFLKYVENLDISNISKNEIEKILGDAELYIINFNYTTYLKTYLKNNKNFKDMLNINGEIKTDLAIFGVDKIQIQNSHRKEELDKFLKLKRGQKDWKLLIEDCKKEDFKEIIFFGHSLADADYSILEEILDYFKIKNNKNIKLIFKTKDEFYCNHKKEVEHFMARYLGKNHKNIMDKIFCIEIV